MPMLIAQVKVKEKSYFWPLSWKPRNSRSGDRMGEMKVVCVSSDYLMILEAPQMKTLWHQNSNAALPETRVNLMTCGLS